MALRNGISRLDSALARPLGRAARRKTARRRLSLALQGGGAHGAFTWGVLDRLLEEDRLEVDGLSGASAGALNAAALASGWLEGGAEGARVSLERLWRRVSGLGEFSPAAAATPALDMMTRLFSPYQLNPLDVNPLRRLLDEVIDFASLQLAQTPRLFVSATELKQGRAALFENPDMTVDVLLASACLPHLYRAVAIDDGHYWDGGFMANPTIFPLVFHCESRDVMIIQIDSMTTDEVPRSVRQINNRRSQIMFNAPLMRELEALDYMGRMAGSGRQRGGDMAARVRGLNLHLLDGGAAMQALDVTSKQRADWHFFQKLKAIGRDAAAAWLERHGDALGERSSLDLPGAALS